MNTPQHTIDEALLTKHILGETTSEEARHIEKWLSADAANRHMYEHFRLLWQESGKLDHPLPDDKDPQEALRENIAWEKFRHRIHHTSPLHAVKGNESSIHPGKMPWLNIAAIFILAFAGATTFFLFYHQKDKELLFNTAETIKTDSLPDGSVVTLNQHSSLTYTGDGKSRERNAHLRGEAFFLITPDKDKPFLVFTNQLVIAVLGTSFNVLDSAQTTRIHVESGLIRITTNTTDSISVLLHGGESILLDANGRRIATDDSATGPLYKYYRPREFICNNTPLQELTAALEKSYHVTIDIANPALRDRSLTSTFENDSLDHILSVIQATFRMDVHRSGNTIILK